MPDWRVDLRGMDELSARELYDILKLRVDVFVVEQACPYPELDGKDADALHLRLLEGNDLLACSRLFKPHNADAPSRIGRVVVAPEHRSRQLGKILMQESILACENLFPGSAIIVSAQSHLEKFYQSCGFETVSPEYLEDGIPHVDMLKPAKQEALS